MTRDKFRTLDDPEPDRPAGDIATGPVYGGRITDINPLPRSVLKLGPNIGIQSTAPMPNWWRRFWLWALIGWTWEKR